MDEGYWENHDGTVVLCTECFTKIECFALIDMLAKLGIKAGLKRRNKVNDTYRIRISRMSIPLLRDFHPWVMSRAFLK
jgi:hypothetical protein